ncbi:hypothetical protein WSM22_25060 [Cytophagales bacterium WSM2-2]|nr:hypothetical protein WSM22_25060 [Cytophagales bacterium WSM2-2]
MVWASKDYNLTRMKKIVGFVGLLVLISSLAFSQESNCTDGIDNDGDGFIDCYDSECAANAACKGGYVGNDANCEAKPSTFPKFSMALDWGSPNQVTDHLTRITIGDLDRDGVPEVITLNSVTDKIYILDGKTGAIEKSLTPGYDVQREMVIGNLNNDNCAELFTYGIISNEHYIISYDCNFTELWRTKIRGNVGGTAGDPVHFGIADFDGDGKVELYAKDMILDAHTGTIIVDSTTDWTYLNGGPVAVDVLGTGNLQLVIGCSIYTVSLGTRAAGAGSITLAKSRSEYKTRTNPSKINYHTTSVADYNLDGFIDVLATGSYQTSDNSTAFFWDVHNDVLTVYNDYIAGNITINGCSGSTGAYYAKGWQSGMGRINIGDLDGDGKLNASYVSGKFLYALDDKFKLLWRKDVKEETSGYTGCTLFDFNGDGKSEVVYRDEKYLYIINGTDGTTYTQQTCVSRTNREYPIVADVDADGATELCVTCGFDDVLAQTNFCNNTYYQNGHVRIFRSAAEPWVPARKLWNQHGYFNVNINDDLTIPLHQQNSAAVFSTGNCTTGPNRPLNSFLNQAPFINSAGCPIYASPDLSYVTGSLKINPPTCPDQNFTASFQITNKGDVPVTATLPITFYSGDPMAVGAVKLNTYNVNLTNFMPGDTYTANNVTINGPGTNFTLYGVVNDAGTTVPTPIKLPNTNIIECNYNNTFSMSVKPLPFALMAEKLADNRQCGGVPSPNNGAVAAYQLVSGVKVTAPYTFNWYNSGKPISGAPAFVGAIYTGVPAGTYTVYAQSLTYGCGSDTISVVVPLVNNTPPNIQIVQNKKATNCQNPNAELEATVNNGVNPTDFTFAWYEGNTIFSSPVIGVSPIASNLKGNTAYTVLVTQVSTGCQNTSSFTVPDNAALVVVNATATSVTCSNAQASVSADVGGNTSNYTFKWYNGSAVKPVADFTGPVYNNVPQGSYTVVATDNNSSCSSSPPTTISVTQTAPISVTAVKLADQTSCDPAAPNGSASANVGGATSGYSFKWFAGQNTLPANQVATTSAVSNFAPGVYTVQATDNVTGCADTDEVTIKNIIVIPTITATTADADHCVPYNGKVTVSVSAGVPADYTFSWYNGSTVKVATDYANTTNILSTLAPGTYTVQAINTILKCPATAITATVLDKSPAISMTLNNTVTIYPSDCNNPTGTLGVQVTENPNLNTLGYTVNWYSGGLPATGSILFTENVATSPGTTILSGISTGHYTVVATDKNSGCFGSQDFALPFANSHKLDTISHVNVNTCIPGNNGSVSMKLTTSTPTPPFVEGDYTIKVYQGSNDTGAPIETINGVTGQPNYATSVPMTPGFYTIVAICTNAARSTVGCKVYGPSIYIKQKAVNPVISATSQNSNTNCGGATPNGSITVGADAAPATNYTFAWFNGTNTATPLALPGTTGGVNGEMAQNLAKGSYTVKVTNTTATSTGCFSIMTYNLFDNTPVQSLSAANLTLTAQKLCASPPDGSATVNSVTENGASVPTAGYSFQWFDSSMTPFGGNGTSQTGLSAGTYYLKATNTTNNCSTATPVQFVVDDQIKGSVNVALFRFTEPTRCFQPANTPGTLRSIASGNSTTGYSYKWYLGTSASGSVLSVIDSITNISITPPATFIDYTVEVTNNSNQCKVTDTYRLVNKIYTVPLSASASTLTNCTPLNGTVIGTVTNGYLLNYSYNWYRGKTATGIANYFVRQVLALDTGYYTVVAKDKADSVFCQSAPQTVHVDDQRIYTAPIAIQISPLTNCDVARPNGVASASVQGNVIDYDFKWYTGNNTAVPPIYTGAEISGLNDVLYTVIATNRITLCPSTSTIKISNAQVTVPPPDLTVLSNVTSCATDNGAISASVAGNTKDYVFHWYIGSVVKATRDFTGEIFQAIPKGFYTATDSSRITGCVSGPTTGEVKTETLDPQFHILIQSASCGQPNGRAEVVIDNDASIESVAWDVNGTILKGPVLTNVEAGTYTVTVTTTLGCTASSTFLIENDIRPFNGLSRNRDGQNEVFYIDCIQNYPNNVVKIFNRAGTLVYQNDGYNNLDVVFDGHSNRGVSPLGNMLPDGTYYYIIDRGNGTRPMAGYIEIVK